MAGRAATSGRIDGEIQEELKRPSDCWYVPVCRVWGDSKEDAQKDAASPEGSDFAAEEGYEEDGRGPEGSDFAAEKSYGEGDPDAEEGYEEYEEDDPDAEEGYEGVWDEVQEALSAMEHEEFDDTTEADCARSQASRPSSAASSQASVRS